MALASRKARALLAYLALSETGTEQRERLAGLLWGDTSEPNARASLRQVLYDIREALTAVDCDALVAGRHDVTLKQADVVLDLAGLIDQLNAGEVPPVLLQPRLADTLLVGYEDLSPLLRDWVPGQRRAAQARLLRALELLFSDISRPRRLRRQCAEAALQLDPLNEEACRTVMRLSAEDGETGAALRAYARLYDALGEELDMEPGAATRDLVVRIKQGHFDPAPPAGATDPLLVAGEGQSAAPREVRAAATPGAQSFSGAPTVAVLPFRPIGPDPVPSYFAEGVVEDTVCMLATLREPVVISSNSTRRFHAPEHGLDQIGRQLGAAYIVSGSIRMAGPRLRLVVELAEAATGAVLWGAAYDTAQPRLFESHDDIAANIARTLVPKLRDAELRRSRALRADDMTAYHLMLRARELVFRLGQQEFEQAGELLRRATALDPGFAPPHAALADWHSIRIGQGWSPDPAADTRALESMARTAIGLDSGNGRALAMLAHNRTILARAYDEALGLFDRALDAAPNDAEALMWSSPTFAYIGEPAEAVRRAERAIALSPQDPFLFRYEHFLAICHYADGDLEAAAHWGRRSLRGNPHYTSNLRLTAAALAGLGRRGEAQPLAEAAQRLQPDYRVVPMMARQAFRDDRRRELLSQHLLEAGFPP